jgi:hypothetical protein
MSEQHKYCSECLSPDQRIARWKVSDGVFKRYLCSRHKTEMLIDYPKLKASRC